VKFVETASGTQIEALWRKSIHRGIVVVVLLACFYSVATLWAGRDAWDAIESGSVRTGLLVIVALIAINILIRATRFYCYQRLVGWSVPVLPCVSAFVASLSATATPGKVGELIKFPLLRTRYPISMTEGLAIHLVERFGDLITIIVFAAAGLLIFTGLQIYVAVGALVAAGVAVICFQPAIHQALLARATRIPYVQKLTPRLSMMSKTLQVLFKPLPVLIGGSLSVLAWACEAAALYLLLNLLDIPASLLVSFAIYGLSLLAGALSMMPGGLGGTEVVMGMLLLKTGALANVALAVALFRICTLWFSSAIGVAFLAGWQVSLQKSKT
jgi:uncharacterized protein (TIRG00374 family)